MKTILVTGAAGFIGSHVADRLLRDGSQVIAIDNFSDYYNPLFKEENIAAQKNNPNYHLYRCDFTRLEDLRRIFQTHSVDAIIHLGAQAGVRYSLQHPLQTQHINITGTTNVFECAREFAIPHVIFASSSSVYGNQDKTPFSEDDNVDHPISPYAASKKACELLAFTYHHLYNITVIGLRLFNVYGERGRPDMSPFLFADAFYHHKEITRFGDGSMQRDFTYVGDIVEGIVRCLTLDRGYEIINLGNAHPVAVSEFIARMESLTGKTARIIEKPIPPGDVRRTFADTRKAMRLLEWQPTTSLEEGLSAFLTWFQQHRLTSQR